MSNRPRTGLDSGDTQLIVDGSRASIELTLADAREQGEESVALLDGKTLRFIDPRRKWKLSDA